MEKILRIKEKRFVNGLDSYTYEGFEIITDEQDILIGIGDEQDCCENAGYLISDDDYKRFEGAELLDIAVVDTGLKVYNVDDYLTIPTNPDESEDEEDNVMFVNINTSTGLFQIVAYNQHNGYYGHEAVVISKVLNHSEVLS